MRVCNHQKIFTKKKPPCPGGLHQQISIFKIVSSGILLPFISATVPETESTLLTWPFTETYSPPSFLLSGWK
jgi:hypothetical protein